MVVAKEVRQVLEEAASAADAATGLDGEVAGPSGEASSADSASPAGADAGAAMSERRTAAARLALRQGLRRMGVEVPGGAAGGSGRAPGKRLEELFSLSVPL